MRKQQLILLSLSLGISALVLFVRISFLPHSLPFVMWLVLLNTFYDTVVDSAGIFRTLGISLNLIQLWLIILIIFLTLIVWSFIHFLIAFKRYDYKAILPLLINIFTIIIMFFMQYTVVVPDFYSNLKEREAVVAMVTSGKLIPQESQKIRLVIPNHPYKVYKMKLPDQYTHLSKGIEENGEINILTDQDNKPKMIVFFNTFGRLRGEPNYTGFIYSTEIKEVSDKDIFGVADLQFYVGLLESKKLKDNWFWVDAWED